mmetsp:Transcript_3242/g.7523  ORF Transcript_3242/g.7523 Transcript_3242/m.7523 type:complete len:465 (-) Transcript_3242:332-1726(-)|eukprot:CAMPEP_0171153070 /NCGR_PEP_ID=MMETSP0766_2-20121228/150884_1 /TAXON_ID=439317 /ORGANISM="Gambierdiscus australes, Strain CAWD 149" /LENGTH=464 /DNA_ID=CAMNT_0011616985 /DNA_START=88 /DNA_END=1482 /DNA_ORIENTATION=-
MTSAACQGRLCLALRKDLALDLVELDTRTEVPGSTTHCRPWAHGSPDGLGAVREGVVRATYICGQARLAIIDGATDVHTPPLFSEPARLKHGALRVVIPCVELHEGGLALPSKIEGGPEHANVREAEALVQITVAKAPVGRAEEPHGVFLPVVVGEEAVVTVDPCVRIGCPSGLRKLGPAEDDGAEGQGCKYHLRTVENWDNRQALLPEVVGLAHPLCNLAAASFHDVGVDRVVYHDCKAQPPSPGAGDEVVDHTFPIRGLVVNPQTVKAGVLHFVELLTNDAWPSDVVCALRAGIEGVAIGRAPMIVPVAASVGAQRTSRVRVCAEEPGHVVCDILGAAELERSPRRENELRHLLARILTRPDLHIVGAHVQALVRLSGPPDRPNPPFRHQELHVRMRRVRTVPELHVVSIGGAASADVQALAAPPDVPCSITSQSQLLLLCTGLTVPELEIVAVARDATLHV